MLVKKLAEGVQVGWVLDGVCGLGGFDCVLNGIVFFLGDDRCNVAMYLLWYVVCVYGRVGEFDEGQLCPFLYRDWSWGCVYDL